MQTANNPRVTVLIEIHAKEGQEEIARETFSHTVATAHKPGMLSAMVYEDKLAPGTYYSVQEWESVEDFKSRMRDAQASATEYSDKTSMLRDAPSTSILRRIG